MAELASVKVALLDIGKEQRTKKERTPDEAPAPAGSKRQAPSPAVRKPASYTHAPSLHILTLIELPAGS